MRATRGFASVAVVCALAGCSPATETTPPGASNQPADQERPPNIVYIYADDLGYNEVGAYGQEKIRTPNIDRIAAEGIRFTQHYSGSAVCAPSRAVLLTGKHSGHAYIRNNKELGGWGPDEPEGQWPLAAEEVTLAEILQESGYATGATGKWGLGGPDAHGHPNRQGFDFFYGYLCQRVAHNYYPTHLWRDGVKDVLDGNAYFDAHQQIDAPYVDRAGYDRFRGERYAPDAIADEALRFIRDNAERPFFLYYPTIVPHVALQVPDDSLAEYAGQFEDPPYLGDQSYLPHPEPRAAYAAMITRMDRNVGRVLDLLAELGLDDDTLVMFSSDNGPTWVGGSDLEFFDGNGPFRGRKQQLYEGGIRVPMVARWPGKIAPGEVTDHLSAQWDVLPTVLEVAGVAPPDDVDGISFLPTLQGVGEQGQHDVLYWELGRQQAVRAGAWKLYRRAAPDGNIAAELFHLEGDPGEQQNLAAERPEVLEEMIEIARRSRRPSEVFPSPFDEDRAADRERTRAKVGDGST